MDAKALYGEPERRPQRGQQSGGTQKRGRVLAIHGEDVFVDIGGRSQGVLSLVQFPEGKPAIGSEVEVTIEGYDRANGLLLLSPKGAAAARVDWSIVAEGMIVEARVTGHNKGGLEVEVSGIRGFIPVSHIELFRVEDLQPYVNQRLRCLVAEANPLEKNLVLSRRALLEKEREEAREKLWQELAEGQIRPGTVRSVKDFGAFIDLGGVDGLLHVSEMSWSRVEKATDLVQVGQQLQVVVLKIDRERRKLSLGLKQLLPSPWEQIEEKYPAGTLVPGKVTRLMDFGAFIELEPGVEGLVHVSELAPQRVRKVGDVVQPGQAVLFGVLKVEPSQRRISLSLKAAQEEAAAAAAAQAPEEPEKPRKPLPPRKTPLRGGL
jgi:small subunit ribosomal protein S1